MSAALVTAPCGKIEGISENGIRKFLGIPYARAGRFEYPREVTQWEGTLSAVSFGSAPIQARAFKEYGESEFSRREFMEGVISEYSEDCLFLNEFAPENAEGCPVVIAVYGGGLFSGQSDEKVFSGEAFAKRGVILVTFNYRVNIFGFCAMKELEDETGKCGNYGYYDQHTAFMWVKHNISAFGGDPDRMSLIGHSAGASSVETQIKSPLNEGLFKGAVIQSSAGFATAMKTDKNREKAYALWRKVYDKSGAKSIEEFKTMPAKMLFDAYMAASGKNPIAFATAIYDENFTSEVKNKPCPVNIICSLTSEDVLPILFYIMMKKLAKSQKGHGETYFYYFKRQLPGDEYGAWHGAELQYIYGTLSRSWRPFTQEDYTLSKRMTDYICNFAAAGDPNGEGLERWDSFYKDGKAMVFDAGESGMKKLSSLKLIISGILRKFPEM